MTDLESSTPSGVSSVGTPRSSVAPTSWVLHSDSSTLHGCNTRVLCSDVATVTSTPTSSYTIVGCHVPVKTRFTTTDITSLATHPLDPDPESKFVTTALSAAASSAGSSATSPISTERPAQDDNSTGLSSGAQAGIAAAVVVLVLVLACLGLRATRRRWRRHDRGGPHPGGQAGDEGQQTMMMTPTRQEPPSAAASSSEAPELRQPTPISPCSPAVLSREGGAVTIPPVLTPGWCPTPTPPPSRPGTPAAALSRHQQPQSDYGIPPPLASVPDVMMRSSANGTITAEIAPFHGQNLADEQQRLQQRQERLLELMQLGKEEGSSRAQAIPGSAPSSYSETPSGGRT